MSGEDRPGRRRDLWDDDTPSSRSTSPDGPTAQERDRAGSRESSEPPASRRSLHHDRARRRFPWWVVLIVLLLVAVLCLGGAWTFMRGGDDGAACDGPLTVAASPEIAEPLEEALDKVEGECADFDVKAVGSADAAQNINDDEGPDIWVPDSSTWVDAIDPEATTGQWLEGQSIATSPVILAVGSESANDTEQADSWTDVINDVEELQMANPDYDTASRLAFHASRVGQPGRIGNHDDFVFRVAQPRDPGAGPSQPCRAV